MLLRSLVMVLISYDWKYNDLFVYFIFYCQRDSCKAIYAQLQNFKSRLGNGNFFLEIAAIIYDISLF